MLGLTRAEITFGMVIGCLAWRLWLSFEGIGLASREHGTYKHQVYCSMMSRIFVGLVENDMCKACS